jgi:hypothetical protein
VGVPYLPFRHFWRILQGIKIFLTGEKTAFQDQAAGPALFRNADDLVHMRLDLRLSVLAL